MSAVTNGREVLFLSSASPHDLFGGELKLSSLHSSGEPLAGGMLSGRTGACLAARDGWGRGEDLSPSLSVRQPNDCCPRTRHVWGTKAKPLADADGFAVLSKRSTQDQQNKIRDQSEFSGLVSTISPPDEFLLFDLNFVFWNAALVVS